MSVLTEPVWCVQIFRVPDELSAARAVQAVTDALGSDATTITNGDGRAHHVVVETPDVEVLVRAAQLAVSDATADATLVHCSSTPAPDAPLSA